MDYLRQLNKIKLYNNRDKKDADIFVPLIIINAPLIALGYVYMPSNNPQVKNLTDILGVTLSSFGLSYPLGVIYGLASKDKNLDLRPLQCSMAMLLAASVAYIYLK